MNDRSMGIWDKPLGQFLHALRDEACFEPPRHHGLDTVESIEAFLNGRARIFVALGGNFVSAAHTELTSEPLRRASPTLHVSTTVNKSDVVCGIRALALPTLGRTERDSQDGVAQAVTVEDSMSAVHSSQGPLPPASPHCAPRWPSSTKIPRPRSATGPAIVAPDALTRSNSSPTTHLAAPLRSTTPKRTQWCRRATAMASNAPTSKSSSRGSSSRTRPARHPPRRMSNELAAGRLDETRPM